MTTTGVAQEEHSLPTEGQQDNNGTKLLFRFDGLLHRALERMTDKIQIMWARRHPSHDQDETDYSRRLRELEGQIEDIDREQQGFRMGNYYKGSRGKEHAWKDWILTIVGLLIVAWLARLDIKIDDISDLRAQQREMEKHQEQTDKHLESTDSRMDRVENRVYRGAQ